jgi:hypothetical protein
MKAEEILNKTKASSMDKKAIEKLKGCTDLIKIFCCKNSNPSAHTEKRRQGRQ